jgi:flagellar biosynthesis/type III secretory pathway chaperone
MNRTALQKLLEQDLGGAQQLNALLLDERRFLERRDVKALDQLLGRKADLLARMEKNDQARRSYLQEAGFEPDRGGLQACCEYLDGQHRSSDQASPDAEQPSAMQSLGEALFVALALCREATAVNANIVHRSRSNNTRLLNLMRGVTTRPDVYNPRGTAGAKPENRTLGSA